MNHSRGHRWFVAAAAVAIFATMAPRNEARGSKMPASGETGQILLTGGRDVLWVVRSGKGKATDKFDLIIRRPGGKWRTLSRFSGSPAAIVTYQDGRLLVVTGGTTPNAHVFSLSDDDRMLLRGPVPGARWTEKNPPAAICPTPPLGRSLSQGFIAVIPYGRTRLSTATTASRPRSKRSGLTVLQTVEGQWKPLSNVDNVPGAVGARISAAAAGNWVYVLVIAKDQTARLLAWDATDKKPTWKDVALPGVPTQPLTVCVLRNQPVLITIAPAGWTTTAPAALPGNSKLTEATRIRLTIHTLEADKIADAPQNIQYPKKSKDKGEPLTLPGSSIPQACSLGKASESQLALLWREAESYRLALVDLNGEVAENKEVEELLKTGPPFDTTKILYWFFIAIPILLLAFILLGRRQRPTGPLILPARFIPGSIPKRLVAMIIDSVPFLILASIVFAAIRPDLTAEDLEAVMYQQQDPPPELILCVLGSLVVWVIYCSIMESRFGATLGKMAMRLEVTSADGRRPTIRQAVLRNLIRPIELSSWLILIFTIAMSVLTRTHQRLGDIMARTVVVEKVRLPHSDGSQPPRQERPK